MVRQYYRWIVGLSLVLVVLSGCRAEASSSTSQQPTEGNDAPVSSDAIVGGQGVPQAPGLRGQITTADGAAVADVLVTPQPLDAAAAPIPEIAIISDGQGYYFWSLSAGRYQVVFSKEGLQSQIIEVTIPEAPVLVQDVVLTTR